MALGWFQFVNLFTLKRTLLKFCLYLKISQRYAKLTEHFRTSYIWIIWKKIMNNRKIFRHKKYISFSIAKKYQLYKGSIFENSFECWCKFTRYLFLNENLLKDHVRNTCSLYEQNPYEYPFSIVVRLLPVDFTLLILADLLTAYAGIYLWNKNKILVIL